MQEWMAWFISLIQTCINWLTQMKLFDVPLMSILVGLFIMGVVLRALLYKA